MQPTCATIKHKILCKIASPAAWKWAVKCRDMGKPSMIGVQKPCKIYVKLSSCRGSCSPRKFIWHRHHKCQPCKAYKAADESDLQLQHKPRKHEPSCLMLWSQRPSHALECSTKMIKFDPARVESSGASSNDVQGFLFLSSVPEASIYWALIVCCHQKSIQVEATRQ